MSETTSEQLAEIEGQATEYTPPEGWRVLRSGEVLQPGDVWVNWEGTVSRPDIQHGDGATVSGGRYIRNIDIELQTVQNQLGESRQRVTQLEELVASLRTINEGAEKAVSGAGVVNDSLRLQLAAVKAELAQVSKDRYALQVELDAAQQVPADSPELGQLRADLEQVAQERDQYLDSYQRIFGDLETIRETTKAAAVESIAEWLEPIRLADSAYLANATMQHLPSIMRHLTGLAQD